MKRQVGGVVIILLNFAILLDRWVDIAGCGLKMNCLSFAMLVKFYTTWRSKTGSDAVFFILIL